uniref:Uncharacterized protein n=1 Tax=Rhipicephalus zambeziensis TaxID=60191 RepID=A0A224YGY4_9ACAR
MSFPLNQYTVLLTASVCRGTVSDTRYRGSAVNDLRYQAVCESVNLLIFLFARRNSGPQRANLSVGARLQNARTCASCKRIRERDL